jgi:hypothetical protein
MSMEKESDGFQLTGFRRGGRGSSKKSDEEV